MIQAKKTLQKQLRRSRVRGKISGTTERPRLSVFRGLKTCFLQIIDDETGTTVASISEKELPKGEAGKKKAERAYLLGKLLGEKALAKGIKTVVFDRGGNRYHGRVQQIADGAREAGLEF